MISKKKSTERAQRATLWQEFHINLTRASHLGRSFFFFGKTVFLLTNNLHGRTRRRRENTKAEARGAKGAGRSRAPRASKLQRTRAQAESET